MMNTFGACGEGSADIFDEIAMIVGSSGDRPYGALDEDDNTNPSSYEERIDLMITAMEDKVTAQLATSGLVGVAAASAIVSAKQRRGPHSFETNPTIRRRQQNRLLKKLHQTVDEFSTRVGQQAVVLIATPGNHYLNYKVFGAQPLEDVMKKLRSTVMKELEFILSQQAPQYEQDNQFLFELPSIIIDGIPIAVDQMTQAQLRAFIPLMLKYSTGRSKPGWGKISLRPPWWPEEIPWENVRLDTRSNKEKRKLSWTHALRQIIINCYKYHGREDLLQTFTKEQEEKETQCTPAAWHTVTSPDGTINIIQVTPNNPITQPDSTTAHGQGPDMNQTTRSDDSAHNIQAISEVSSQDETVYLGSFTQATLSQNGQIIFTNKDAHENSLSGSGVITLPVSMSMYQTTVAKVQHIHTDSEDTMCVKPKVSVLKLGPNKKRENTETLTVTPEITHQMMVHSAGNDPPQVLQVLSLEDASLLTQAMESTADVKSEETIILGQ